jgi:hypothetical protein
MSAVPVAPQPLQDPATESIEPPSVDRELMSVRILHQACAHCPLGGDVIEARSVWLIWFVLFYLVHLVYLVSLVQTNKQDKPNKPNNGHLTLADFFSILL